MSAGQELEAISRQVGPAFAEIAAQLVAKKISRSGCTWIAGELEEAAARLRRLVGVDTND